MSGKSETVCVERRRYERRPVERPCKVLHSPSLRYMAARTRDISPGGALLELPVERPLAVGERIDVLVDWERRGLVGSNAIITATIVRVGPHGDAGQQIGVSFDRELGVTLAA